MVPRCAVPARRSDRHAELVPRIDGVHHTVGPCRPCLEVREDGALLETAAGRKCSKFAARLQHGCSAVAVPLAWGVGRWWCHAAGGVPRNAACMRHTCTMEPFCCPLVILCRCTVGYLSLLCCVASAVCMLALTVPRHASLGMLRMHSDSQTHIAQQCFG